jgi:D-beta-D-heptose 7-phosphate kinase/D-beta-D-heptose 1-phosphate adenosyltransferase
MKTVYSRKEIVSIRKKLKEKNKKVVFTNGCFDILHAGHVDYLTKSKEMGDVLIVGLNSDVSIKSIKGEKRPIINEHERALIISNLKAVDYVTLFDEDTPFELISALLPDILIKGEDWKIDNIVGKDIVEANGGKVKTIKFVSSQSTSNIIQTILSRYGS